MHGTACLAAPGGEQGSSCFDFKGLRLLGSPSGFPQWHGGGSGASTFLYQVGEGPRVRGPKEVLHEGQRVEA